MRTFTIPGVTCTEMAMLQLALEDKIAEQKRRLRQGVEDDLPADRIDDRRRFLAASASALEKLRGVNP